jgi:hypothetical protein
MLRAPRSRPHHAPGSTGRRRALRALALAPLACASAFWPWPAAAADGISVADARLAAAGGGAGVELDAQFDFELPFALEDAVNRGIALYFVVEFELYRRRWYWFDRRLVAAAITYRLSYSPLTRQYRLARGALALSFDSLNEALGPLRRVRNWRVIEPGVIKADEDYSAQVRLRLDTSQLPKPFQITALTNRDWTLASDWRNVPVSAALAK